VSGFLLLLSYIYIHTHNIGLLREKKKKRYKKEARMRISFVQKKFISLNDNFVSLYFVFS
jgi:hypothetical protein